MIIAVFPNTKHEEGSSLAQETVQFFKKKNVEIATIDPFAKEYKLPTLEEVGLDNIDFIISMGGDGTILNLAHKYHALDAAILGINLGHLGFMADVPVSDLIPSLEDFIGGHYTIEDRIIIDGLSPQNKHSFAVNDYVIHRGTNPSLIELCISFGDKLVNTFEADGIILSTPNGSTAYSLAAGGPILSPGLEGIVITPISPHTISNRPIVISPDEKISVEYLSPYEPIDVVSDGIDRFKLETGETFTFQKSSKSFKLVNLNRRDYFSTLRSKLGWSGKLR